LVWSDAWWYETHYLTPGSLQFNAILTSSKNSDSQGYETANEIRDLSLSLWLFCRKKVDLSQETPNFLKTFQGELMSHHFICVQGNEIIFEARPVPLMLSLSARKGRIDPCFKVKVRQAELAFKHILQHT
jgi:hypothetical protein